MHVSRLQRVLVILNFCRLSLILFVHKLTVACCRHASRSGMQMLRAGVMAVLEPGQRCLDGCLDTITSSPWALTAAQLRSACQQLRIPVPKSGAVLGA